VRTSLVSRRFIKATPVIAGLALAIVLGGSLTSFAFVRLANGPQGLYWPGGTTAPITFTISSMPAPGITDGSDAAAIRLGFRQWQNVPSTSIRFNEDLNPNDRSRTDWQTPGLGLTWFDTNNSSGMFSSASGLVAVTPVSFSGDGSIISASMIFNAKDHSFTTTDEPNKFDVQSIATHEAGHFIGLDHSAVVGSTLDPFAFPLDTRLRSLEQDDIAGASTIYPRPGFVLGTISGVAQRSDGTAISGGHAVAEDLAGTPASSALTQFDGSFQIQGLSAGTYVVYVEPLDGPVRGGNLSLATSHMRIDTDFATTFTGGSAAPRHVAVSAGVDSPVGTLTCAASNGIVMNSASPMAVMAGDHTSVTVFGSGIQDGDVISITGDGFTVSNMTTWAGGASFSVDIASGMPASLRSVRLVRPDGNARVLTGGLEVRDPPPLITGTSPASGPPGTPLTVNGSGFQSGAIVILGGTIIDGASAGGGQVSFNIPSSIADGVYDLAVENPDGQWAKITGAFEVKGATAPSTPSSGSGSGSQLPTLSSSNPTTSPSPSPAPSSPSPSSGGMAAPAVSSGHGGGGGCAIASAPAAPASLAPFALVALALLVVRRRS
jgi:MYXO-CTERM domain-containing protein